MTIDPSWSALARQDTWVQKGSSTNHGANTELRVGTFDGGTTVARSLLKFDTAALAGKKITKAELRMTNHYSYSCTASDTLVQRLTSAWGNDVSWATQPAATSAGQGKITDSLGYSTSCPGGVVHFPLTPIVQHWADHAGSNYGLRVLGGNETSNSSWKRYRSADYAGTTTSSRPYLVVTYNSYPNTSSAVGFSGQSTVHEGTTYVRTATPTLTSVVSDPDKGNVRAEFDLTTGASSVFSRRAGSTVSSGATSSTKVPTALVDGRTYAVKSWAHDGTLGATAAGPVSLFTVDATAPAAPAATGSRYGNGGWREARPSSNVFTFTSTSTDTVRFQ